MDVTITHKPLSLDEALPVVECYKNNVLGRNWSLYFFCSMPVLVLAVWALKLMDLFVIITTLFCIGAFILPPLFSRRTRITVSNAILKFISSSPLYHLEHSIHLTEDGFETGVPGFELSAKWEGVAAYFLCPGPRNQDVIVMLLIDGFPIFRKSDFPDETVFYELLNLLQRRCLKGGER